MESLTAVSATCRCRQMITLSEGTPNWAGPARCMADGGFRLRATERQACLEAADRKQDAALHDASSKHHVPGCRQRPCTARAGDSSTACAPPCPVQAQIKPRTSAASAGGYPYTPVLMAGNARFSSLRLLARSRQLLQTEKQQQ
jgi:hypothetical protein